MSNQRLKDIVKSSAALRRLYYRVRILQGARGQSDEGKIIRDLARITDAPKTFIEFGSTQSNLIVLLSRKTPIGKEC